MKRPALLFAAAAASLPATALAHSYHIVLSPPASGKLLKGHAGVQAADDRTGGALVRIVAPGNEVQQRGTVRVLVMNLGSTPFELGPDQVTLTLADGTVLRPTPIVGFEDGRDLIEREQRHAAAVAIRNRNNFGGLAQAANSGPSGQFMAPVSNSEPAPDTAAEDWRTEDSLLPGAASLDAISQLLVPMTVAPQKAWGGYYVFDMPKAVYARKADQPLTIAVRTGNEEHRFAAVLKWK